MSHNTLTCSGEISVWVHMYCGAYCVPHLFSRLFVVVFVTVGSLSKDVSSHSRIHRWFIVFVLFFGLSERTVSIVCFDVSSTMSRNTRQTPCATAYLRRSKASIVSHGVRVSFRCAGVDAKEFRLAQMCASNIIIYMDHLQDLIHHYEVDGHFNEIIAVLEQGACACVCACMCVCGGGGVPNVVLARASTSSMCLRHQCGRTSNGVKLRKVDKQSK